MQVVHFILVFIISAEIITFDYNIYSIKFKIEDTVRSLVF